MSDEKAEWREFEEFTGSIQEKLAPTARVRVHERILGRSGVWRTVDVTVREQVGAYAVLVAVDCKRHGRPVELDYVVGCAAQAEDVGANLAVVVANTSFTSGAKKIARNRGIAVVLQTLRYAVEADWEKLVGPSAWSALTSVRAHSVHGHAVTRTGLTVDVSNTTPVFDPSGTEVETVGDVLLASWKSVPLKERQIGEATLETWAMPGEVFVRVDNRLEEVASFNPDFARVA